MLHRRGTYTKKAINKPVKEIIQIVTVVNCKIINTKIVLSGPLIILDTV
jgi:hypothetical protein